MSVLLLLYLPCREWVEQHRPAGGVGLLLLASRMSYILESGAISPGDGGADGVGTVQARKACVHQPRVKTHSPTRGGGIRTSDAGVGLPQTSELGSGFPRG